ncbi:thiamine-phosphate kinase [Salinisphaera aquimarina]|uniref:Thiamine-monophosphate kinase n=1 Tax=Salinisphaera aquimarina TaxID=2094031 RepID=A0ABV7ESI3_9GAMM
MQEFALIARLAQRLRARRGDTRIGIGDDAAVIAPAAGQELAVTSDTLIAGRHFPDDTAPFDIGFKAIAVNLSDLAAMGAEPAWLTLALTAPALDASWCDAFIDGALAAIGAASVDIVGGDTTRGDLSITVTAIGTLPAAAAITRAGARVGDLVAVTGTLGDAAQGLALWAEREQQQDAHARFLIERLCRPQWRNGSVLRGLVHAAVDVSDGLAADLGHILSASQVGARIDIDTLPASTALMHTVPDAAARRRMQLSGGDDYELCLILPAAQVDAARAAVDAPLTVIGVIEAAPGLRCVDASGAAVDPLQDRAHGWDHFSG